MALPARLGPYDIQAKLGAGGMGEVYRARDTRLSRDVAIKVLPEVVARDGEHLARFRREAQVLAALNHPHIAAIYGIEEAGGVHFLVLELVEGETLADRLRGGALPVAEAIAITRQICEAVASAHERGVIHRDLKPANIALTADDRVKVLDFGLARSAAPAPADQRLADSPTITAAGVTANGVILGTAPYMSPEQARGRAVDKRSDVFSLGCVVFEMVSGRRPFAGETVTEILANVLKSDPDWAALPRDLPPAVLEILRGALQKDRKDRIGDLSTVLFLLDRAGGSGTAVREESPRRWRPLAWLAAGVLLGALVAAALLWRRPADTPRPVMRFTYEVPPEDRLILSRRAIALSPDGTRLAFTGARGLVIRSLSDTTDDLIPGTLGATMPIFAPDGQSLVFWQASALKRLAIGTGSILTLAQVGVSPNHISWTGDRLLYAQGRGTVLQLSASGGTPVAVLDLGDSGEVPLGAYLLPDEDTLLYTTAQRSAGDRSDRDTLFVRSLRSGATTQLLEFASDAAYVPTGHIVFARQGTLYAVPFDLKSRTLATDPVPVLEGVGRATTYTGAAASRAAQMSIATPGLLAYVAGPAATQNLDLVLYDRNGVAERLDLPVGVYQFPRVSPDGTRVAVEVGGGRESVVAIHDRASPKSLRRLTFGGSNRYPTWSPNGQRITFQSDREGDLAIFWQPVAGGAPERLTRPEPGVAHVPEGWTPDGQVLFFSAIKDSGSTLWTLSLKDRSVTRFADVRDSHLPINAAVSPDGRWVAYQFAEHVESGEAVTFVEPFPPTGTKYEVGSGGRPMWSRDGTRLFIVPNPSQWFAFEFKTRPEVAISSQSVVPRWFGTASPSARRPFDLLPDGRVIAAAARDDKAADVALRIEFVVNWFEELNTRAPAPRRVSSW